jgi:hypothetical protein
MDSGMRIATTNAKGERDFMDDAARNAEIKRLGHHRLRLRPAEAQAQARAQ